MRNKLCHTRYNVTTEYERRNYGPKNLSISSSQPWNTRVRKGGKVLTIETQMLHHVGTIYKKSSSETICARRPQTAPPTDDK